ncbi:peptidoglycan DD-metalloendopeptidase family protein [uncultured Ruminococcus sp.]|uniref:peptidoglycan DD-metalloendopeptidase family protein n=1 Tax=uncultured Ruminococcus sp. TaxID=165186 RepID=UPI00262A4073|nr:peptidoglycan DD-metalloendopeptidase family protein [uncultured Ruminococcus sp.]
MAQVSPEENDFFDQSDNGSFLNRIGAGISSLLLRAGLSTVKFTAALLLWIFRTIMLIAAELFDLIKGLGRGLLWLFHDLTHSLRKRNQKNKELQIAVSKAKKEGDRRSYISALARFAASYLFGEGGICYTAFNYILPIISFAFLLGVIRYGLGLEYGINVEFNGKDIGIITEEAEFDRAEHEALQRIHYSGEDNIETSANFSLKIISENDRILTSEQLANKMLEASDEELAEAYGIYIDGEFIGAVPEKEPVEEALDEHLLTYHVDGNVKDITYKNKIEYAKGIYLASSIVDTKETIRKLTSSVSKRVVYIAKPGDTAVKVCQKYNMNIADFRSLNPLFADDVKPGVMLNVKETESYLPIQYVIETEMLSLLKYETIEVETSSLNVGSRKVLVEGSNGEKHTTYEITYVDGIERSRKVISSKVTREPVVEEIGIGIYSAHPDSKDTVLTGTGEFGWPVNGGYISDPFLSDRNHKGLDIAAPGGTEIYAAADGVVIAAGWNSGGYGNVVQIAHDDGYQTVYGHMSSVLVSTDQEVRRGQLIGLVGTTGNSTGNHCHFEVRYLGVCKNPANYLNTTDFAYGTKKKEEDEDDK